MSKVYDIAFELSAKLEGSYTSGMSKVLGDLTEVETKARGLNALSVSGDMVQPLRDNLKHLEREIRDISALRVTGDVFRSLQDGLDNVDRRVRDINSQRLSADTVRPLRDGVKDLVNELKDLDRMTISASLLRPIKDALGDIETRIHAINGLRLNADLVRPLREAMRQLNLEFRDIRSSSPIVGIFTPLNSELREAVRSSRELQTLLNQIRTIRMPGNQFGNDMQNYIRQVQELERRMRELQNARGPSGGGGDGGGGGPGGAGSGGMGKLGMAAGAVAIGGTAAVAGVGLAGAEVISFASEYQTAMAQLQAATGATESEMQGMSDSVISLYNQSLGEGMYDLAEGLSIVKQVTNQTGKELEETTRNAIAYSDVFGEDITESIKAADTVAKNFGITTTEAYNLMAQGAQKGLNKSGELLDSANEYAPHFATLGFSGNQMMNTFAAGLEAGAFNLDKVGDAVKEFNIRSKDMSKTSVDAYKAIGMNAEQMSQTFAKGGPEAQKAFEQIVQSISSIEDPVKKNAVGVGFFGTQFEDVEADVIKAMGAARSQFDMTKNSMDDIAKVKYDTIGKAFQGIGRQLQTGLILPLSQAALPILQKLSDYLQGIMPIVKNTIGKLGGLIGPAFDRISNIAFGLFNNMGGDAAASGFSSLFDSLIGYFTEFKNTAMEIWGAIGPHVINVIGSIGKIIKQVIPIVLSIAKTFYQISTKIISFVAPIVTYLLSKLWPVISKIFAFIANEVMPMVSAAIAMLLPKIMTVVNKIGEAMSAIFNFVKPILDALFAAFDFVFPIIKSVVVNTISRIEGVISGLMTTIGGIIDFITGVFSGDWEKAWQGIKDIFGGIFDSLGAILVAPINYAIDLINMAIREANKVSIDIPDWLGGGTFGVNIQEIGKIGEYAKGGYVTKPELAWVGEGKSNEWIIPENNSQRSRDLWQSAGSSMGLLPEQGRGDSFTFAPNITITGGGSDIGDQVKAAIAEARIDMERWYKNMLAQQRRVSIT